MNGKERNKLCFCGSGLKYKRCHLIIESKIQTEKYIEGKSFKLYEMQELFDATLYPEICIAKDLDNDCDIKIIKAHTLTKSLSLEKISSKGHEYSFINRDLYEVEKNSGFTRLKKCGIRTASTFKGFCSYHDDKLFSCIEKRNFELSREQCVALIYRTLALELYKKRGTLEFARRSFKPLLNSFCSNAVMKGSDFLVNNLRRSKLDFDDINHLNDVFINVVKKKEFSRIRSYALKVSYDVPFVCTGLFAIYKDINNEIIQDIFNFDVPLIGYTALNIFYAKDGATWLVLSWLDIFDEINTKFIEQLKGLTIPEQVNVLGNLMISYTENTYFSIEYIDRLSAIHRGKIEKNFNGTYSQKFGKLTEPNFMFENIEGNIHYLNGVQS